MAQGRPICGTDADVFLDWLTGAGFRFFPEIEKQDVLDAFVGFTNNDLRWLCAALRQTNLGAALKKSPDLAAMRRATLARDVALLRG